MSARLFWLYYTTLDAFAQGEKRECLSNGRFIAPKAHGAPTMIALRASYDAHSARSYEMLRIVMSAFGAFEERRAIIS